MRKENSDDPPRQRGLSFCCKWCIMVFAGILGFSFLLYCPCLIFSAQSLLQRVWCLPPVSTLVDADGTVIGNTDFLLDLIILQSPFGTFQQNANNQSNPLLRLLSSHPRVQLIGARQTPVQNDAGALVQELYHLQDNDRLEDGTSTIAMLNQQPGQCRPTHYFRRYRFGYVSRFEEFGVVQQLWANAPVFLGVAHPVYAFEAWYNNAEHGSRSISSGQNTTNRTELRSVDIPNELLFHIQFSKILELVLQDGSTPAPKLFLYEAGQVIAGDGPRYDQFRKDLFRLLDMQADPAMVFPVNKREPKSFEKVEFIRPSSSDPSKQPRMNICHYVFRELRQRLVSEVGAPAASLIRRALERKGVAVVSQKAHMMELLDKWTVDPCLETFSYGEAY